MKVPVQVCQQTVVSDRIFARILQSISMICDCDGSRNHDEHVVADRTLLTAASCCVIFVFQAHTPSCLSQMRYKMHTCEVSHGWSYNCIVVYATDACYSIAHQPAPSRRTEVPSPHSSASATPTLPASPTGLPGPTPA